MSRPVHFDITAEDPDRAVDFYGTVFGWKFTKWDGGGPMEYWMIETGKDNPGIDGGMSRRSEDQRGTVNTVGVDSIDASLDAIQGAGGSVAQPKMPIPGVGWFALCADTEGNKFGIMQPDEAAG